MSLKNKTAVVTGASKGIGRRVSYDLALSGAYVFGLARSRSDLERLRQDCEDEGLSFEYLIVDMTDEKAVIHAVEGIIKRRGRIDILINNAGTGFFGETKNFKTSDFRKIMDINMTGLFIITREVLKHMEACGTGYIINVSSVVGFKGYSRQAAYTASKHAVMGFTKSLSAELHESGIRVSAVLPGGVETDLVKKARPDLDPSILMQPEDVSGAVFYLLSLSERAAVDQIYIRRRGSSPF